MYLPSGETAASFTLPLLVTLVIWGVRNGVVERFVLCLQTKSAYPPRRIPDAASIASSATVEYLFPVRSSRAVRGAVSGPRMSAPVPSVFPWLAACDALVNAV